MTDTRTPNPRFELRAYEAHDCCRAARALTELAAEGIPAPTRDQLAARWALRNPRHTAGTGKKAIRVRLSNALTPMAVAGLVLRHDDGSVSIANPEWLAMASRNLDIVQDAAGVAVPPSQWTSRPEAPEHLRPVQAELAARPAAGAEGA